MFTGIIREIGILKRKTGDGRKNSVRFVISNKKLKFRPGESVAVNGVCLTVVRAMKHGFEVDVIPETLRRSNFAKLTVGTALNLEPSIKAMDRFHGHFISGHVDATAKVLRLEKNKNGVSLIIEFPKKIAAFIVKKGSIAINGVSLTVVKVMRNEFVIALIPYTLRHTNLGKIKPGDFVNIEIDMMARYGLPFQKTPRRGVLKIAIVISKFNKEISGRLFAGALRALRESKFPKKNIAIFEVPGAFEIPYFIQKLIDQAEPQRGYFINAPERRNFTKKYRGFIALGCVIRGETDHYRAVCDGVTFGLQKAAVENRVPVMFGVLMCRNMAQAIVRSENNANNKGYECGKGLVNILKNSK